MRTFSSKRCRSCRFALPGGRASRSIKSRRHWGVSWPKADQHNRERNRQAARIISVSSKFVREFVEHSFRHFYLLAGGFQIAFAKRGLSLIERRLDAQPQRDQRRMQRAALGSQPFLNAIGGTKVRDGPRSRLSKSEASRA